MADFQGPKDTPSHRVVADSDRGRVAAIEQALALILSAVSSPLFHGATAAAADLKLLGFGSVRAPHFLRCKSVLDQDSRQLRRPDLAAMSA